MRRMKKKTNEMYLYKKIYITIYLLVHEFKLNSMHEIWVGGAKQLRPLGRLSYFSIPLQGRSRVRPQPEVEEETPLQPPPEPLRRINKIFSQQKPHVYDSFESPEKAAIRVRGIERTFRFLECTDAKKMICMSYQLHGEADYWWESHLSTLTEEQIAALTWEDFKAELYERYIPETYCIKKEAEFMNLKQVRDSVRDYDRKFCALSRYVLDQVDTDAK